MTIGALPYITHIYPLGGRRKSNAQVELYGVNLPASSTSVSVSVDDLMAVADEAQQILEYSGQLEEKSQELERTARQLREANEKLFDREELPGAENRRRRQPPLPQIVA